MDITIGVARRAYYPVIEAAPVMDDNGERTGETRYNEVARFADPFRAQHFVNITANCENIRGALQQAFVLLDNLERNHVFSQGEVERTADCKEKLNAAFKVLKPPTEIPAYLELPNEG